MSNIKTIFLSSINSEHESELEVYATVKNEIMVELNEPSRAPEWICLDLETAIKFSKELRRQISKAKERSDKDD